MRIKVFYLHFKADSYEFAKKLANRVLFAAVFTGTQSYRAHVERVEAKSC